MIWLHCFDHLLMDFVHYRSPHWGNPWGTPCCFWQGSILHQDQGGLHFVEAHQSLQRCWPGLQNKENESRKGKNEESTKDYEERTIGDIWSRPGNVPKLECPVILWWFIPSVRVYELHDLWRQLIILLQILNWQKKYQLFLSYLMKNSLI